ncbi:motility protein A [Thiosulfativibrio zosterae]|uniref:Flagellar motor protein PomA n=1 Tax=Thiosulfativibrio zosterae TaxID=2675053 RepID=A0A6F8PPJ8_9GAMM|nr:MotA/TolQ/ExbB proton channel family protein [Thiosulfativibrio zosterae]BBP44039.1 flagellar motor protein PomA [Thiosulfativibrio zosterae]
MSFSTLIGLFLGLTIVLLAMAMGSSILLFINVPSIMIVFGGTIAATMIRYSMAEVFNAIGMSFKVLKPTDDIQDLSQLIDLTEEMLRISRKGGMLALENIEVNNAFYRDGVRMLVDGYSKDLVQQSLKEQNKLLVDRAETSSGVFSAIGDAAPAFGMIGTLVGLIQMLSNLSDPSTIGPAMSVAMLTTLYGAMIANLFALPMADKISSWAHAEANRQHLIIDAIESLASGHNPAVMRDLLLPYLQGKKAKSEALNGKES